MANAFDALVNVSRKPFTLDDLDWALEAVNKGPDASAAIVSGVFVESALRDAILSRLVELKATQQQELFRSNAPLSTFSSLIVMGRALGLFDSETKHDLTAIRHIRNAFAHGGKLLSFEDKEVANVCNTLKWLRVANFLGEDPKTPREKFSFAVRAVATNLLKLATYPKRPVIEKAAIDIAIASLNERGS